MFVADDDDGEDETHVRRKDAEEPEGTPHAHLVPQTRLRHLALPLRPVGVLRLELHHGAHARHDDDVTTTRWRLVKLFIQWKTVSISSNNLILQSFTV